VVRSSYVSETGKRLLGFTRPDSAIKLIIATPQRDTGGWASPRSPCSPTGYEAKIVCEDVPDACTRL
jgi:hypothetical protein